MPDLKAIQSTLREEKIDGWLFYDILHRDPIAYRVLGLSDVMAKRRWFYWIPAKGEPRKLVHRIESFGLDSLPGDKMLYSAQDELQKNLPKLLGRSKTIAMQYSPKNAIPYVSLVDAGTVELIRSFKKKVVSSVDLVQRFEATWTQEQYEGHLEAGRRIDRITRAAFERAAKLVRDKVAFTEFDLQSWMLEQFRENQLVSDSAPNVSVGPHSGDPHYAPTAGQDAVIGENDFVLIDLWAKCDRPRSVYSDLTRVAYVGREVPQKIREVFDIVRRARDAGIARVKSAFANGAPLLGWEVDKATRDVIDQAGYGQYFCHRTGHSIGQEVHGNGANMDGLETREDRRVMRRTCFSIEPGIYLPEFGVRSEVDVFVDKNGTVHVTGGDPQTEVAALLP
jgi:Xaa-Pro dipeptidase